VIKVDDVKHLFDLDYTELSTWLDRRAVTKPTDYLTAVSTVIAMYWVLDVEFPKGLDRTLAFLSGHVLDLVPFKPTPFLRKALNAIYS
jgi:hypothetical protein